MSMQARTWIGAMRLRTLPLAIGGILLGSFLPEVRTGFQSRTLALALITAVGLQILSNLANDYGDFDKGTDNEKRVGPTQALQSGSISPAQMKKAIVLCTVLTLISGLALIAVSFELKHLPKALGILALGLAAIWASLHYTMGNTAYGYRGWGDVFVFLFFGIVSVAGVSFLYLGRLDTSVLFPAAGYGLLSAGVLNINNMRDIDNDRDSNKRTLVVLLGSRKAAIYHFLLIASAFLCFVFYLLKFYFISTYDRVDGTPAFIHYIFPLVGFVPILINTRAVLKIKGNPAAYNPHLKGLSLSILFFVLFFISYLSFFIK